VTKVNIDMLRCARAAFAKAEGRAEADIVEVMEISMRNLLTEDGAVDGRDFLARADVLGAAGKTVMISDTFEYYRLATYLRGCTSGPLAMVLGAGSLRHVLDEKYYEDLEGGILEALGRLFGKGLRFFVYPMLDADSSRLVSLANLDVPPALAKLYGYLVDRGALVPLEGYDAAVLPILARDVLRSIEAGDPAWQGMVPPEIAEIIQRRGFFGCGRRA
jgi:hypothetical protein